MEEDAIQPEYDIEAERTARLRQIRSRRDPSERTPLLNGATQSTAAQTPSTGNEWPGQLDFEGLSWRKRPSVYWLLPPFFLFTLAFGGVVIPKLNLVADMVCREYYSDKSLDPDFPPILFGGTDQRCKADEVSTYATVFYTAASVVGGTLSAITTPKIGALSDRFGRLRLLCLTTIGMLFGEVITIIAGSHQETFSVYWFLLAYAVDGICGSFGACMALAHSYAADCTPPAKRATIFGYFHGALFLGIAFGPLIANQFIRLTGSIISVFYVALVCHLIFLIFLLFIVPESLSAKRQLAARDKYKNWYGDYVNFFKTFFTPLQILWPKEEGSSPALRRNLVLLCAIDTIAFGVAMGSISVVILYLKYNAGWSTEEENNYVAVINICRITMLFVVLPFVVRRVRGPSLKEAAPKTQGGCDNLDLGLIRFSVIVDMIGYFGYAASLGRSVPFILSGCVAAMGSIGSPSMQAALTKHIPPSRTGEILGANGLLHSLARVIAPIIFSGIFISTKKTAFPEAIFVCLGGGFAVVSVLAWFLRPGLYLQEQPVRHEEREDGSRDVREL